MGLPPWDGLGYGKVLDDCLTSFHDRAERQRWEFGEPNMLICDVHLAHQTPDE